MGKSAQLQNWCQITAKPTTIAEALVSEDRRRQRHEDEQVADLINVSMKLEGRIGAHQLMRRAL